MIQKIDLSQVILKQSFHGGTFTSGVQQKGFLAI